MNRKTRILGAAAGVFIALGATGGTSLVFAAPPLQQPPAVSQMNRSYLGLNLSDSSGMLVVESVKAGGPAATAGIQVGDQITAINGTAVTTVRQAAEQLRSVTTGSAVSLLITRNGSASSVSVTASEAPKRSYLGVRTDDATGKVVVSAVDASSPAATAGFQVGDQIVSVNGTAVTSDRQFHETVRSLAVGSTATVVVTRNNSNVTLTATVTEPAAKQGGPGNGGREGQPRDGQRIPGAVPSGTPSVGATPGTPPSGANQGTPPQGGRGGMRGGGSF